MLLVTFHGTSSGINNVWGFPINGGGQPVEGVLSVPAGVTLDELRGMAIYDDNLYVVNGGKSASNVLVFKGPPQKGPRFNYLDTVIGVGQSIMHPFGIAWMTSHGTNTRNSDSPVIFPNGCSNSVTSHLV